MRRRGITGFLNTSNFVELRYTVWEGGVEIGVREIY